MALENATLLAFTWKYICPYLSETCRHFPLSTPVYHLAYASWESGAGEWYIKGGWLPGNDDGVQSRVFCATYLLNHGHFCFFGGGEEKGGFEGENRTFAPQLTIAACCPWCPLGRWEASHIVSDRP